MELSANYLDDCPICQKIKEHETLKVGTYCCLLTFGGKHIAATNTHGLTVTSDAVGEALDFLQDQSFDGLVTGYENAPGHWALQLITASGLPPGQSLGKAG